jgi:hypothetical protein
VEQFDNGKLIIINNNIFFNIVPSIMFLFLQHNI